MCPACVHEHGWAGCDHGGGGARALPPSVCASTRVHMAPGEEMFKNGAVSPELTGVVSKVQRRQEGPPLLHPREETACFVLRRQSVAGINQVEQTQKLH